MKLTTTLITAVLATHTASALPTGGSNVNEKAAFSQRLQREMLNNVHASSGVPREESWASEQQVDPKLTDSAFRTEMAIRVIRTPTSQPAPWDAGETPAVIPSPWEQDNKLSRIQQKSHIPTHLKDGGRQLANTVEGHSELNTEQGMSNGLENANTVRDPLPASDISLATPEMRNAGRTRANTATSSSENQQPGLKSKVRELFKALIHGKEKQHAGQGNEIHDRLQLTPRNHDKYHKEAHQQELSEPSIGVRQMSLSSENKAMTGLPQDAMNQNLEKQEISASLDPRTQQVPEGQQMQESQSELMGCLRAAMGDIDKQSLCVSTIKAAQVSNGTNLG